VTVTNVGKLATSIGKIIAPADFALAQDFCSNQPIALKAKCTFDVTFAPPAADGKLTPTLAIPHDATNTNVKLTADALAVTLSAPKAESFAPTLHGTTSQAKTVTITNTSPLAVTLQTGVVSPGANFQIVGGADQCSGVTIGPLPATSKKCKMTVKFAAPMASPGAVSPETLSYGFTYGGGLSNTVAVTLKGMVK